VDAACAKSGFATYSNVILIVQSPPSKYSPPVARGFVAHVDERGRAAHASNRRLALRRSLLLFLGRHAWRLQENRAAQGCLKNLFLHSTLATTASRLMPWLR
jgi:hypothetical protein